MQLKNRDFCKRKVKAEKDNNFINWEHLIKGLQPNWKYWNKNAEKSQQQWEIIGHKFED